jgi:TetR/AcrR family transcriptional regulator, cholesterol catabolism regulator
MSKPDARENRWEPTERWERRYQEALDAAAIAFADKGYLGASTKDIADQLNIRQASLYYYLPSKDAALAAVCERGVRAFIGNLRAILERIDAPIGERIHAAVANHLRPLAEQPYADYIRVFLRHRHELPPEPRAVVARLAREYQGLIERLFKDGVARAELRGDLDPHLATLAFLGLCNSVIGNRSLPQSSTIDQIIDEYAGILSRGTLKAETRQKRN